MPLSEPSGSSSAPTGPSGRLLELGAANLASTLVWLAGGVLLHDGVLAPATVAAAALGIVVLPARLRSPVAAGFLVLATVTVTAVPVLGRFGAREDNPTLLDRDYTTGWVVLALSVLTGVAAWSAVVVARARREQPPRPPDRVGG